MPAADFNPEYQSDEEEYESHGYSTRDMEDGDRPLEEYDNDTDYSRDEEDPDDSDINMTMGSFENDGYGDDDTF
jgi:hypothetical protein